MTSESGSSESGASRITERAVSWLLSRRSSRSIGEPERQMIRVPRRSGTLTLSSSSMSTLSRSARITITGSLRLSLARVSSEMIVKIDSDQPEDDGVVLLEHDRAAAAQVGELGVDAGGQHADQRADDEQAAEGEQPAS